MKRKYKAPDALIELLEKEDVLTASPNQEDTVDNPGNDDDIPGLFEDL